mmetsp:Transcript_55523/g.89947  ORF Transcript_55523/g.89947 Transcript_55523/m.89947 type:complete len:80 (+) Transcript_55523:16-255(+)
MFDLVRRFTALTDGDGDAYYGGSMYYGDGGENAMGAFATRTWCGFRNCDPYEWRREEADEESQMWQTATPKSSSWIKSG